MHFSWLSGNEEFGIVTRDFARSLSVLSGTRVVNLATLQETIEFLHAHLPTGQFETGPQSVEGLARQIVARQLVVIAKARGSEARATAQPIVVTPRQAATPAPPPPESSPPPQQPPPDDEIPASQAAALESAAEEGAPVCEE